MAKSIEIGTSKGPVPGAWSLPKGAAAAVVVAHGAGGDMDSPLLVAFTDGLGDAVIGSLRFDFPYAAQGRRAPDPEPVLRDAWTEAFAAASKLAKGLPVLVGGKSLGGRIASLVVADGMPAAGLIFVGYPLHPPGKPERQRVEHLGRIEVPMLFLQGTKDPFARWELIEAACSRLGDRATLHPVEGGDHSFRVKGRRRPDAEIGRELADVAAEWIGRRG